MKHPIQPLYADEESRVRFRGNAAVQWMLKKGRKGERFDLNDIGEQGFDQADLVQLSQLIGYTLRGYHELPFVTDEDAAAATAAARESVSPDASGCRDEGCLIHSHPEPSEGVGVVHHKETS